MHFRHIVAPAAGLLRSVSRGKIIMCPTNAALQVGAHLLAAQCVCLHAARSVTHHLQWIWTFPASKARRGQHPAWGERQECRSACLPQPARLACPPASWPVASRSRCMAVPESQSFGCSGARNTLI